MTETPAFDVDPTRQTVFTGDDMTPEVSAALSKEIHVTLPMAAWDELEYLADDFPEQVYAQIKGEVEGEEEGDLWVFYCNHATVEQLLEQTLAAIPSGWTAKVVPVPQDVLGAGRIEVSRA